MKAIIIDDELLPGKMLEEMIRQHCYEVEEIEVFSSVVKAIEHLRQHQYDLLFLDVEMPEMNSFDFLKKVSLPSETEIIFVTAHSQYALEAFKAEATHYLLKPVEAEELILAVRRAFRNLNSKSRKSEKMGSRLSIYDGEQYMIVDRSDIIRMEASGSYTRFVLRDRPDILASRRLGYYEGQLENDVFFRCHHSHVINLGHILSIDRGKNGNIRLRNNDLVPLATSRKDQLKVLLGFDG